MHEPARGGAGDPPSVRRRIVRRPAPEAPPPAKPRPNVEEPYLLRPAVDCPKCGARPALRVTRTIIAALANTPTTATVATYQCQRRGCGAVYPITADAYHRAA
jgi:hypothetical protein